MRFTIRIFSWSLTFYTLRINNQPQARFFDNSKILFTDDTYLTLSDKSVVNLETIVNSEQKQIDTWLTNKKLPLNYSKTCYVIINTSPYNSCNTKFQLLLNSFPLKRQQAVKYVGIYIDEILKWTSHVHQLSSTSKICCNS